MAHLMDGVTIGCGRMHLATGHCAGDRVHDYAVVALHVGKGVVVKQSGTWQAEPGDLQVIPAGARHGIVASEGGEVLAVGFCPACLRAEGLGHLLGPLEGVRRGRSPLRKLPAEVVERLSTVMALLEGETHRKGPASAQIRRSLLEVVLVEIGRLGDEPAHGQPSLVADALAYLEVHALEPLTLDRVAEALGRSPAHLTTVVRRETGKTVGQWIVALRMAEARRRLRDTDEYVEIVGERVGYPDAAHFGRVFRREHGVSPAKWRAISPR